jgi:hypothetical protein
MVENDNNQGREKDNKKTPDIMPAPDVDVVDVIEYNINELVNQYIDTLNDPEEIYQNNGLFVDMLKYIYKVYLGDILNNKTYNAGVRYDYSLLNKIFNIYTSLVYRYKQNKRPSILEYSLFVNIERHVLYNIANGITKKATPDDVHNVKSWFLECENQLTNGSSVFEIFLLKSQYRYNDNLAPIPIESQGPALSAGELPDLSIAKIANKSENDPKKD